MAVLGLPRDAAGAIILPGATRKVTTWPFMFDTTLPATLATSGTGTATLSNQAAGTGDVKMTVANGAAFTLATAAALNLDSFESVWWEAESIWAEDFNVAEITLSLNTSTAGIYYKIAGQQIKTNPNGVVTSALVPWAYAGTFKPKLSIGLLLLPHLGHAYVTMGDQIVADADLTGAAGSDGTLTLGSITPSIAVQAAASGTTNVHIEQMKLTTVSY